MVLYNVTVKVDHEVAETWLHWMRTEHLPAVMETGCFEQHAIYRLLSDSDPEGITYCIQYQCPDLATLENYRREFGPALMAQTELHFGGKYVAFRSVLEAI